MVNNKFSEDFSKLINKERGFNKIDGLLENSWAVKSSDGFVLYSGILKSTVDISKDNTQLYPSELEYLGVEDVKDFTLGKNILELSKVEDGFKFGETNISKYMVSTDRFYSMDDVFISSDWATPIVITKGEHEHYISSDYFKNKDKMTIEDYILIMLKEDDNFKDAISDLNIYDVVVVLNSHGIVEIKL